MSLYFHGNAPIKFQHQYLVTKEFIIPFLERNKKIESGLKVLELGCGEGGVLKAFTELGCTCLGIDLSVSKIEEGKKLLTDEIANGFLHFETRNIFNQEFQVELFNRFDLIILKDTIEHIPHQKDVLKILRSFLAKDGLIFFAFPPWSMPFGGHQQIAVKKWGKAPYIHLLPKSLYLGYMGLVGENEATKKELAEIYDTRISIGRFENIAASAGFSTVLKRHYAINPIYQFKFGWKPRIQNKLIAALPYFRDFFTTTVYYLVKSRG